MTMVAHSAVALDARVHKEATTLAEAGYQVTVIGSGPAPQDALYNFIPTRETGPLLRSGQRSYGKPMQLLRWLVGPSYVAHRRNVFLRGAAEALQLAPPPDVVHAHDFDTLGLASSYARRHNAALIYDAHELWSGRNTPYRPALLRLAMEQHAERRLGAQAAHVITVSPGIAAWLRDTYGWSNVTVVRNTYPQRGVSALEGGPTAVLFTGRVMAGRDLETVGLAARRLGLPVRIMGHVDRGMESTLGKGRANVELCPPVDASKVPKLLRDSGIALVTLDDSCLNHRLALPNKLFQAIQAGVPVVASGLPEIERVVKEYGLGETYRPGNVDSFVRAVDHVMTHWSELVSNVAAASPSLAWELDARDLLNIYQTL